VARHAIHNPQRHLNSRRAASRARLTQLHFMNKVY
jgi:hypothetical protein